MQVERRIDELKKRMQMNTVEDGIYKVKAHGYSDSLEVELPLKFGYEAKTMKNPFESKVKL